MRKMTQAQRETGGFLPEKDWESECGMDDIQDALDEGSEKAWVGCFQGHRCIKVWLFILSRWVDEGKGREYTGVAWREEHASRWGEEEHARRWRREKYPCHRREKHIIRSEEGDNSEQRVPIRPRSLGCGPPSFREGASFRKRISINVSRPLLVIE